MSDDAREPQISAAIRQLSEALAELKVDLAGIKARLEANASHAGYVDALRTKVTTLEVQIAASDRAHADSEARLRVVERVASQAVGYAALAAIVVSAVVAALLRVVWR